MVGVNKGEKFLPDSLPLDRKWEHPFMKFDYTSAMHEDAHASDVSNLPGPTPTNVEVQYFHVLQKHGDFSGMAPTYAFINDSTMITLSFGRANTTLLLLDIKDTIKVLDDVSVPGRGNKMLELAGKKGRSKIFSNTARGAYSYLSGRDKVYIPGANNNIIRVKVVDRMFDKDDIATINLKEQIEAANMDDEFVKAKDGVNLLTALMPDVHGNIWFTSRKGVIGMIHRNDKTPSGCPKVYGTFIQKFGLKEKLERPINSEVTDNEFDSYTREDTASNEMRQKFRKQFKYDHSNAEEIQNSFSVGENGVYIVTNNSIYIGAYRGFIRFSSD